MDILGYNIHRKLGSGGSARVYLATQHAFGTPVAIKVISPATSDSFRKRFLREAEIAKGLEHPNIVHVRDAGVQGDALYLVMDYLPGGDLNRNLEIGLHMQQILSVIKNIASALDYAHGKGVVHRDVKPENILFDEHGSALLADFGIAGMVGDELADKRSLVTGTPHYMSPEQAAGGAVDGRSDFYSLGVVFYLMLTGHLPFQEPGDPRSLVRVHELPLPLQLAPFKGVMSAFLAKSPEQRFQSGAQIAAALDSVQSRDLVPNAVVKTRAVTTAEIEAVAGAERGQGEREHPPALRRRWNTTAMIAAGALLVVTVGAGVWYVATGSGVIERTLAFAGLAERPGVVAAWQDAEALRRDPNQNLDAVITAYRSVLALDAEYEAATLAIEATAEQWKRDVGVALDSGDTSLADAKLGELASVFPDDPALTALFDRLGARRRAETLLTDTGRLLNRAGLSHVPSVESAIVIYKEVLRLIPGNPEALAALNDIAVHYGELAARRARDRDVAGAMANFSRAVTANAEFEGVQALRATLSEAEALQAEIDAMLQQAADLREAGALIEPSGANAAEIYRRVLAAKPEDSIAIQGLSEISSQVRANFDRMLDDGRMEAASGLLDRAAASGIGDDSVAELKARFDAELARIETAKTLVAQAEALYEQGYVTGPVPGDNAVARLREALRLDPDNADGIRLLSVAATRLASVAQDAYDAGMIEEGLRYLDLALTITPGISRWRERREVWQARLERTRDNIARGP